ncbi:MAG: hypothetical protein RBS57_09535 [Desulforhabdus sp.]|jgi:hypothetical protein|nr:hypothetical protein [Desulforhabdus sp.]
MTIENKNTENKKSKKEKSEDQEQHRVVISKDGNMALEEAVARCTSDFKLGAISKSDIANYIFLNLTKVFSDSDVKALRAAHFDEKKVLGSILRNDDDLPEELRKAIRAHYGIGEREKKRTAKQSDDSLNRNGS